MQEKGISALERAEVLLWLEELIQFHEVCLLSESVCPVPDTSYAVRRERVCVCG